VVVGSRAELVAFFDEVACDPFGAAIVAATVKAAKGGDAEVAELCRKVRGVPGLAPLIEAAEGQGS
jgi:hypothetical protein